MSSDEGDLPGSFAEHVEALIAQLPEQPRQAWTRVQVVEVPLADGTVRPDLPGRSVTEFEHRWAHIVRHVDRDWVNLSAYGIDAGTLIVAVEWFGVEGVEPRPSGGGALVNFSGSAGPFRWPWG